MDTLSNSCTGVHNRYAQRIREYINGQVFCSTCDVFLRKESLWKNSRCPCCHVAVRSRTHKSSGRKDLKRVDSTMIIPTKPIYKIKVNMNE